MTSYDDVAPGASLQYSNALAHASARHRRTRGQNRALVLALVTGCLVTAPAFAQQPPGQAPAQVAPQIVPQGVPQAAPPDALKASGAASNPPPESPRVTPQAQPAAAAAAVAEKPAPQAGIVVIDDGQGIEAFAGAQEAVRAYVTSGRGQAKLLATTMAKAEETLRGLAADYPTLVVLGETSGQTVEQVAKELPDNRFTLIGARANGANIRTILFRDKETDWLGAWLAGRMAGEGSVGFVGLPADVARGNTLCAVAQGLAAANRKTPLLPDLESASVDFKLERQRGAQLARLQIDRGARVIIMPAGPAGMGAMETVRDMGALGVTRNRSAIDLFPRNVLAVQSRNYDLAVQSALAAKREDWRAGITSIGLAEKAVALVVNDAVAPAPPADVIEALKQHVTAIATGTQTVQDINADGLCPVPGNWSISTQSGNGG